MTVKLPSTEIQDIKVVRAETFKKLYSQPFVEPIILVYDTALVEGGDCPRLAPVSPDIKPTLTV